MLKDTRDGVPEPRLDLLEAKLTVRATSVIMTPRSGGELGWSSATLLASLSAASAPRLAPATSSAGISARCAATPFTRLPRAGLTIRVGGRVRQRFLTLKA